MLLAMRCLMSIAWPEGYDGRYYWTHCGWVDNTDWPNTPEMHQEVIADLQHYYSNQILAHGIRFYIPHTTTVFADFTYGTPGPMDIPAVENPNILMCARWRLNGDDGSYSYHLHRRPIGSDDIENGAWSPDGYFRQQATCNTFIGSGIWRTGTGALIISGGVAQLPVAWQLRHGTKRRRSRFWLPS